MVVGGYDKGKYQNDSQLSSLTRSCSNLQNYPIAIWAATGAIVSGHPIICGGRSGRSYAHSQCYHHNKDTNSWTFLTNMSTKRWLSASVPVNGKLLVLGGWDEDYNSLATSEYVSPDGDASQPGHAADSTINLHILSSSLDTIISILCTSSNHCHP